MLSSLEILVSSCEIPKGKKSRQNTENMTSLSSKCLVLNLKQRLTFEKRYYISKRTDYDWLYFVKLLLMSYQKRAEQNLRNEGEDRERRATVWDPCSRQRTTHIHIDTDNLMWFFLQLLHGNKNRCQIPAHTLHPCPNLPLCLVLRRQADSHAETLSTALRLWGCCLPGA